MYARVSEKTKRHEGGSLNVIPGLAVAKIRNREELRDMRAMNTW